MIEGKPEFITSESNDLRKLRFNIPQYPEATFYLNRLADLLELRSTLDSGEFPFSCYEGVPIVRGEYKGGENKHMMARGLRYGVLFAINGVRNSLNSMQPEFGEAAQRLVDFDRKRQGLPVANGTAK